MSKTAKITIITVSAVLIALILFMVGYVFHHRISTQTVKVAVYENETEILTIKYERNGKQFWFNFAKKEFKIGGMSSWALWKDETTAIFDATNGSLPTNYIGTFKFYDDYVEYYVDDELCKTLFFVTDINIR